MWKGAKTGLERGKKRVGTGKNGLERGQKLVLNGIKNGISPNSTIWNGVERPFFAVPHLSSIFFAVPALFSPVFDDFRQKREKKGRQKMEERERKEERVPFQCSFPVPIFSRSFHSAHL